MRPLVRCDVPDMVYARGYSLTRRNSLERATSYAILSIIPTMRCTTKGDSRHIYSVRHSVYLVNTRYPMAYGWNTPKASGFQWICRWNIPWHMHGMHRGLASGQPIGRRLTAAYRGMSNGGYVMSLPWDKLWKRPWVAMSYTMKGKISWIELR